MKSQQRHPTAVASIFVRLSHHRFIGRVLLFVLFVFVLFIRIVGGIILSQLRKALQSVLTETAWAMYDVMLLLLKAKPGGCYGEGP